VTTLRRDPLIDLLRRRTWAGWIDVLGLFIVFVILSIASGNGHIGHWTTNDNGFVTEHRGFSLYLHGGLCLLWMAIALLYHFIGELETGQTIGKRIMGLKVVMVNGHPLGVRSVLLRTVGRIVDVLPGFYLVGWIAMRGPHKPPQRLGDRLAGTTVVTVSHP
jgi:uncharacterized RDD family membrane protein YckC